MDIGTILKSARENKSLKQGSVATKIGITQTYLSLIESNRRTPSIDVLKKLIAFYEIPKGFMDWLSLSEDKIPESKRESYLKIKPTIDALIKEYYSE